MFCICAILFGYGVWSVQVIADAGSIIQETYDDPVQALDHALSAHTTFHRMRVALENEQSIDSYVSQFSEDLSFATDHALTLDVRLQIEEIQTTYEQWHTSISRPEGILVENMVLVNDLNSKFDTLTKTMSANSLAEHQRAINSITAARNVAVTIIIIALFAALIIAFVLSHQITTPLRLASRVAKRISTGDFDEEIPDGQNDETGTLLRSMRVMQINIQEMLAREERQRLSAETRMADALENAAAAIMMLDRNNNIVYANSKVESYFPTLAQAIKNGDNFVEALNQLELVLHNRGEVSEGLIAGLINNDEIELDDGRWLRVSRSEVSDGCVVMIWTDISELKNRESALQTAMVEAKSAVIAKSNFIATMSHEIRTPMNGVLGMAQALRDTELSQRQQEIVSIILMSGTSLMTVIEAVLDFAKLDSGRLELTDERFNLRQTLNEVVTMMQASAKQKSLDLFVRYAAELPQWLRGDAVHIHQILANLVGNAVKFTDTGYVCVEVTGQVNDDVFDLQIAVLDTGIGIGIAPADRERIFMHFEQADGSNSRLYEGTGLGLAISKELVEMMDGTIGLTDNGEKGSRFSVSLSLPVDGDIQCTMGQKPRQQPAQSAERTMKAACTTLPDKQTDLLTSPIVPEPGGADTSLKIKLLIAEDNVVNQMVMNSMVDPELYDVTFADNGQAAVELFKAQRPAIFISDISMPIMDGLEATRAVRDLEEEYGWPMTPIIAATAHVLEEDQQKMFAAGMNDFLPKPIRKTVLDKTIAKWLGSMAPHILKAG